MKKTHQVGKIYQNRQILEEIFTKSKVKKFKVKCLLCNRVSHNRLDAIKKQGCRSCSSCKPKSSNEEKMEFLIKRLWRDNASRARKYSREFMIEFKKYKLLILSNCYYCNKAPANKIYSYDKKIKLLYSGLDRIDTKKGYTLDNVVPCCKICNRAKSDLIQLDFYIMCQKIVLKQFVNSIVLPSHLKLKSSLGGEVPPTQDTNNQELNKE